MAPNASLPTLKPGRSASIGIGDRLALERLLGFTGMRTPTWNGSSAGTPVASKSDTLRVATVSPCSSAVAATAKVETLLPCARRPGGAPPRCRAEKFTARKCAKPYRANPQGSLRTTDRVSSSLDFADCHHWRRGFHCATKRSSLLVAQRLDIIGVRRPTPAAFLLRMSGLQLHRARLLLATSAGRAQRTGHPLSGSSQPGLRVEEAAARATVATRMQSSQVMIGAVIRSRRRTKGG